MKIEFKRKSYTNRCPIKFTYDVQNVFKSSDKIGEQFYQIM